MLSVNKNRMDRYSCDGVTAAFVFDFKVTSASDIEVYIITTATEAAVKLVLNTDYTVALTDDGDSGGTVTLLDAAGDAPAATELLIIRNVALTQLTDLVDASAMPAETLEDRLDMIYMILQRFREELDRAVKLAIHSQTTGVEIEEPSAGKGIKWDAGGDLVNTTEDLT